jgi:pimeloyl-ACP methyl ester carboxylesterase
MLRPIRLAALVTTIALAPSRGEAASVNIVRTGHGLPVVLVPGLSSSAFGYRKLTALIEKAGYESIVVEPLGVGGAPRPRGADYSLTAQADRIAAALDSLGVHPVAVVAHGVSGSIALRLAYRHPHLAPAIVLVEGGASESAATPALRGAMRLAPVIRLLGNESRFREELRKGLVKASGDASWVTEEVVEGYAAGGTADLGATLDAYVAMSNAAEPEALRPNLSRVASPVELLVGGAPHPGGVDREEIEALRKSLPRFTAYTVPGVGHFIHEEKPEAVFTSLVRAVRKISRAQAQIALRSDTAPTE